MSDQAPTPPADPEMLVLELIGAWSMDAMAASLIDDVVAYMEYADHVIEVAQNLRNGAETVRKGMSADAAAAIGLRVLVEAFDEALAGVDLPSPPPASVRAEAAEAQGRSLEAPPSTSWSPVPRMGPR